MRRFARLADVLIRSCIVRWKSSSQLCTAVSPASESRACVGKLGGREMTTSSWTRHDRGLRFQFRTAGILGPRPLYGAQYFSRLTQRLISALTAQTNYGVLYQVDMRLRPSGRSGPLATHIDGFADYQRKRSVDLGAHGAHARSRRLGDAHCLGGVERDDPRGAYRPPDPSGSPQVSEMRRRSRPKKAPASIWDLKLVAGGLIDIEFIAQYLRLVHAATTPDILDTSTARVLEKAWRLGVLSTEEAEVLRPAMRLYDDLTQDPRLRLSGPFDPGAAAPGLIGLYRRAPPTCPILPRRCFSAIRSTTTRPAVSSILGVSS